VHFRPAQLGLCREHGWRAGLAAAPLAGLAGAALAQGDSSRARDHASEVLVCLDSGSPLGCEIGEFWVYLSCFQVLNTTGHHRAPEVLSAAHRLLMERAARLPDETLHRSFLENVAENREIVREWEAAQAREQGSG
jgi:hypothetical protein